ncbi:uncharacterized protein LOC143275832 isoform X2 [Babylonia areolata]
MERKVRFNDDPCSSFRRSHTWSLEDMDDRDDDVSSCVSCGCLKPTPFVRKRLGSAQVRHGVHRISEYLPEHDCFLPRAPAFKALGTEHVDNIVRRLYSPPSPRKIRTQNCSNSRIMEEKERESKFSGYGNVSREELHEITQRLTKPTMMAKLRQRPPRHLITMMEN